ncbi:MAG TPA: hypothetical protein VFU63_11870 [Ktedonobacterales bacterium]|nr:hypothetical protein [Ktedonobacterales bacterium]
MGQTAPVVTENRRPGLITFAAIMMFVAAAFTIIWAIQEFSSASWIRANLSTYGYGDMAGYLWAWGIFDLVLAAVAIYAGVDLLRGGAVGLVIGLAIAGVSAARWFFYIPAAPWTALAIIAIDVLIIYGLVSGWEYFERAQLQ